MRLVLHDRTTDDAAKVPFCHLGFGQVAFFDQEIPGRHRVAGGAREQHASELVGARLAHGVEDGAAGAAILRVVHAGQDLKLLDGFDRDAGLGSGAGAERIVSVVAAVDRYVVVLGGLPGSNNRVVAHLGGGRELDARQEGDRVEVVAVHRGKLAQLGGRDVAADSGARGVHQGRLPGDRDCLLEAPDGERQVDRASRAARQDQPGPLQPPESGQLRQNLITPRYELGREIRALGARRNLAEHTGLLVGHDNRDAWQDRALFIRDFSSDFSGALLGEERGDHCEEHGRKHPSAGTSAHLTPPLQWTIVGNE
jgi:hypothetical protein